MDCIATAFMQFTRQHRISGASMYGLCITIQRRGTDGLWITTCMFQDKTLSVKKALEQLVSIIGVIYK